MSSNNSGVQTHRNFFSLSRSKKKNSGVKRGQSDVLGGGRAVEVEESAPSRSLQHQKSRDSLKYFDSMSLLSHFKRNRHDKSSSSSRSTSVEPPVSVPRIIKTTEPPSNVSRELLKPQMAPATVQDRSASVKSNFSAEFDLTIAPEEDNRRSTFDRSKSAISRSESPPDLPAQRNVAIRSNHIVTDAMTTFRAKLQNELKETKETALAAGISSESLFGFIANERLRIIPAKGSKWDKILKWAEDFERKLSLFEVMDDSFIPSSKEAVELILACIQLLLKLGPQNSEALERAFGIFHECGLVLEFYKRNISLLVSISEARRYLSLSLADMLALAVEMTLLFRKSTRSMSSGSMISIDFNLTFGQRMESFASNKNRIAELMWTWQLDNSSEIDGTHEITSIENIRQWLLPQDRQLQTLAPRAEFTCEWLDRPLTDFARSKDRVLTITAEVGAGKSFLFSWILERLQRPIGNHQYHAIQAVVDNQVPAQATQISLVKKLLLQLLEQNVGNVTLFRCLTNVMDLSANTKSTHDAEDALWYTLETSLQDLEDVVLVIDGLDSLEGDEAHKLQAFEHLHTIATKNQHNVRLIILSRPFLKPWPKKTRQVAITAQRTTVDVRNMAKAYFSRRAIGSKQEVDNFSDQIALRSKGSFIWADMALQLLSKSSTASEISTAIKDLPSTPGEIIAKKIVVLNAEGRLIISWLLCSKRPLSIVEIQALLELDTQKAIHQPRSTNMAQDIAIVCGSLVIIQNKAARFRNDFIRSHLLELGKNRPKDTEAVLPNTSAANKDLTARLLLYVKICVSRDVETSLIAIRSRELDSLFKAHALLEYATRNWLSHFQSSTFYANGQVQTFLINAELKNIFPTSTLLARLEQKCWDEKTLAITANSFHLLALTVRRQALGDSSQAVMQSFINVAESFQKVSAPLEASKYFYHAAKLGQKVLGPRSNLAIACATASLDISAGIKGKTIARNEAITQREELLNYVIDTDTHQGGANSALVAQYNNDLADLYTSVKENEKAEALYRKIYKSSVAQNGQFSVEATSAAVKLQTVLYKEAKHDEVVQYTQPIFEAAERNLEVFDIRRIEITLRMANTYEKKKDFTNAEELYISLWRGLTVYCRNTASLTTATSSSISEGHERKIQISIAYARFLRRQGRVAEAQNILHGVWLDYEHMTTHNSNGVVKQLNEVGEELKFLGILDAAIAVFKSVWGYFKASGQANSAAAVSTGVSLMGAVQENIEKKKSEAAKVKAAIAASGGVQVDISLESADIDFDEEKDDEADAVLDEIMKAAVATPTATLSFADGKQSKEAALVTVESRIQTCETLSTFFMSKQKWSQCIEVCSELLKVIWPALGSPGTYGLPAMHRIEAVRFTRRLALAYSTTSQTDQAEKMYVAIFQSSLRSGLKCQDEFVMDSSNQLIEFHKKTQQWNKVLAVYQKLLEGYKTSLGARNVLTIRTIYIMGDICVQHRLKGADTHYLELVRTDKNTEGVISKDTLPAALALSKIYYEQKRWNEVRPIYASIWYTFTKRSQEYSMSIELVQTLYKRYATVLETHLKVDNEEIRKIALNYRESCIRIYGAQAEITMSASMALVAISSKSSDVRYQQEAVVICEEIIAKLNKPDASSTQEGKSIETQKSNFQLSLLASAKRHLAVLYGAKTEANAVAGGTAASDESMQKAGVLWNEQFEINKTELGTAHKATLASLASLIGIGARSEKVEVRIQAQKKLDVTVVAVLSESGVAGNKNIDSFKLHESAISLAKIYIASGFQLQAWALLKQLRLHIIYRGQVATAATNLKLSNDIDRRSMVFLASFEETLHNAQAEITQASSEQQLLKASFSDIMVDLLTEGIFYDRYSLTMASKELFIEQKLFDGARLYVFLKNDAKQHAEQIMAIEDSLFKLFIQKFGTSIKTEALVSRAFLVAIMEELGQRNHHEDDLVLVSCTAVTGRVYTLLLDDNHADAAGLSTAWYQFMVSQNGFSNAKSIPFSFKLSLYLAGLGSKITKSSDAVLRARMLELSKIILRETLTACKTINIDLVQLQASELNSLVALLGEQRNYEDLEWLLTQLWSSRIIQISWSATTIIALGRRLVEVLFLRAKHDQAISLAESIAYNLRHTWGLLDAATVDMNNLLSSLCVTDQRYTEALDVHNEILRALLDLNLFEQDEENDEVDDDASEITEFGKENAATLALQQLEFVRLIYGRNAGWPDSEDNNMVELISAVVSELSSVAPDAYAAFVDCSKWSKEPLSSSDTTGTFIAPLEWEFSLAEETKPGRPALGGKRPSEMLRRLLVSRQKSYVRDQRKVGG